MIKFKIISDSMTPLIPVGAEINIKKIDEVEVLKRFDIIVFKEGEKLVCHYLWHVNKIFDKDLIVTRSLKSGDRDTPFSRTLIYGRVVNFRINNILRMRIILKDLFFGRA